MERAQKASQQAIESSIQVSTLTELSKEQQDLLKKHCTDGSLVIYSLPGGNVCVPTLSPISKSCPTVGFTHVKDNKVKSYF